MAPVTEMPVSVDVGQPTTAASPEKKKKSKSGKTKDGKTKKKRSSKKKSSESGVRTKFLLESLRQDYYSLQDENAVLREIIESKLPNVADVIFQECCPPRKTVSSIDELADMMPKSMTIAEGDEDDEDDSE
eukprot:CAMPEP_0194029576 /NCGR_PEP_ID=MMETSP0009_2-20130614/3263_1 /TAXON_ID=210454 /ORGANISM="Grammatophora oceanica, Strain CCMP 410" /LENGTH=130 /DNA_ID=CAMNT_0038669277 /DNA_START=269 /DNA_END=661 /DNA_ORIENTATION=+